MKKELKYLVFCDALNEADPDGMWGIIDKNGVLYYTGIIDGKDIEIGCDEMIRLSEIKEKNEEYHVFDIDVVEYIENQYVRDELEKYIG